MSKNILITGPSLAPAAVELLESVGLRPNYVAAYSAGDALVEAVRAAAPVGIISRMGRIDRAVFDTAPGLRVISKHGVGVDNIDVDEASARGVPVLVARGANAVSVAEHAMALLFAVAKRIGPLDRGLREGRWEKPGFSGRELAGARLGFVAFGAIARLMSAYARAFGI
jgi:D-3-phosphoglycerate dehydrogenase